MEVTKSTSVRCFRARLVLSRRRPGTRESFAWPWRRRDASARLSCAISFLAGAEVMWIVVRQGSSIGLRPGSS